MIAGLANAERRVRRARMACHGGARLPCIATNMSRGDRLGHSWRAGKLLFPGLASDHANMIRAALALYEATGERSLSRARARLARRARSPLRQSRRPAAISSPPTTPRAWWCGRTQPPTRRRPIRTRSRRTIWCGSPSCPARTPGARRPTGCSTALLPFAADNIFMHLALVQRARPAAARGRDRGRGRRAGRRTRSLRLRSRCLRSTVSCCARPPPRRCRPRTPRRRRSRRRREPAAFICVGERCSLPVTEPARIAEVVKEMRA